MKYDAIVVGSGISGMTSAALLALEGKRVLLLEQHNVFGGLMQTYRRDRLTFPTGVHSLGGFADGQIGWRYFNYLGVLDRLDLVPMAQDAFQRFEFPGESYDIPVGHEAYRERLIAYFPDEARAIDAFLSDMTECMEQSAFYGLDATKSAPPTATLATSLSEYLNGLTRSERLRRVLAANYPLHGIEPNDCPLFTHFAVTDSYLQSAYRVDERRMTMAKAFLFRMRELGVEMRRGAEVAEVECDGRSVSSVRLTTGERFASDVVVYTGHPKELVRRCGALRPVFRNRVLELEDTVGFFTACFAWSGSPCPAASSDIFIYKTHDLDAAPSRWDPAADTLGILYLAAAPCDEHGRYPLVAIASAHHDEWTAWSESGTGQHGEDYGARKGRLAEYLMNEIRRQYPECASSVDLIDSNTPLTLEDYTLSPSGTGYGLRKSARSLLKSQVGVRTSVRGLLMAGQSCQLPGILGSMISAVSACAMICGQDVLLNKIDRATV